MQKHLRNMRRARTVVLIGLALVVILILGRRWMPRTEQAIDESGIVTVVSVMGGHKGKYGGTFAHRVRLESGTEGVMNFSEIISPGAKLWVSYRRYPASGRLTVEMYVRR
jgi:hypothetical protein